MSAAARQSVFADDLSEDPRNALLDAFEAQVVALIDNGFEVQVRARLTRLLPAPQVAPSDSHSASRPEGADAGPKYATADDELALLALIADCKRMGKLKATALSHAMIGRIQAIAEAELSAVKSARSA